MRIVSLAPSNTEILYALGAGDSVVATTGYCDHPSEAADKPDVGGWLNVDTGTVRRADVDVVMTSTFLQDDLKEELENHGIDVLHVDPSTLDEVYTSIKTIGAGIGREARAEELVDEMREGFEDIRSSQPEHSPLVYCEEWNDPPCVSGNWVPDLIDIAGGTQPFINAGEPSEPIQPDTVADAQPGLVVLHWCGYQDKSDIASFNEREDWPDTSTWEVTAIHDSLLNRPGPRLVNGCKELQERIKRLE